MFLDRLKEGSTWAGFAASLGTLGSQVPAPYSYVAFAATALCGLLAILLKDKGTPA